MDLTTLPLVYAQAQPAAANLQFDVLPGPAALVLEPDTLVSPGRPQPAWALGLRWPAWAFCCFWPFYFKGRSPP